MGTPTTDRGGIQQAIRALRAAGYALDCVDDRGDEDVPVTNETEALDAIMAVDLATLYVTKDGRTAGVLFVLGNDPSEVICDYQTSLEDVLDPLIDSWIDQD